MWLLKIQIQTYIILKNFRQQVDKRLPSVRKSATNLSREGNTMAIVTGEIFDFAGTRVFTRHFTKQIIESLKKIVTQEVNYLF